MAQMVPVDDRCFDCDRERISEAQLAGVRARLLGTGLQPETADRWFDAWVLEAATRDRLRDGAYRTAACDGITAERGARPAGLVRTNRSRCHPLPVSKRASWRAVSVRSIGAGSR
jgi:hypothetical protein